MDDMDDMFGAMDDAFDAMDDVFGAMDDAFGAMDDVLMEASSLFRSELLYLFFWGVWDLLYYSFFALWC